MQPPSAHRPGQPEPNCCSRKQDNDDGYTKRDVEEDARFGKRARYHRIAAIVDDVPDRMRHQNQRCQYAAGNRTQGQRNETHSAVRDQCK